MADHLLERPTNPRRKRNSISAAELNELIAKEEAAEAAVGGSPKQTRRSRRSVRFSVGSNRPEETFAAPQLAPGLPSDVLVTDAAAAPTTFKDAFGREIAVHAEQVSKDTTTLYGTQSVDVQFGLVKGGRIYVTYIAKPANCTVISCRPLQVLTADIEVAPHVRQIPSTADEKVDEDNPRDKMQQLLASDELLLSVRLYARKPGRFSSRFTFELVCQTSNSTQPTTYIISAEATANIMREDKGTPQLRPMVRMVGEITGYSTEVETTWAGFAREYPDTALPPEEEE